MTSRPAAGRGRLRTERLDLEPVPEDTARRLLAGQHPAGFAADHPAVDSLTVMRMVLDGTGVGPLNPLFVRRRADGLVIGEVGCILAGDLGVLGYGLVPSAQGQGFATEAVGAVLEAVAARGDVRLVIGRAQPENRASRRVMERIGMTEHGLSPDLHGTTLLAEYRWAPPGSSAGPTARRPGR